MHLRAVLSPSIIDRKEDRANSARFFPDVHRRVSVPEEKDDVPAKEKARSRLGMGFEICFAHSLRQQRGDYLAESSTECIVWWRSLLLSPIHNEQRQCGSVQATIGDRDDRHCEYERRESEDVGDQQDGEIQKQCEHFGKTFRRSQLGRLHNPEAIGKFTDAPPIERPMGERENGR